MELANDWKDYEILDMASGEKLERWGNVILVRPDPQIIWNEKSFPKKWNSISAKYNRNDSRTEEAGNALKKFRKIGK